MFCLDVVLVSNFGILVGLILRLVIEFSESHLAVLEFSFLGAGFIARVFRFVLGARKDWATRGYSKHLQAASCILDIP